MNIDWKTLGIEFAKWLVRVALPLLLGQFALNEYVIKPAVVAQMAAVAPK